MFDIKPYQVTITPGEPNDVIAKHVCGRVIFVTLIGLKALNLNKKMCSNAKSHQQTCYSVK